MTPKREPEPLYYPTPFFWRALIIATVSYPVYVIASFIWPQGYVKYIVAVLAWLWLMWVTRFRGQRPGYPII